MMREYEAQLVVDSRCNLGEGPIWHERENRVYWLDVHGKKLHSYEVARGEHKTLSLPITISSFVFKENGVGAIAAGEGGFYHLDLQSGELRQTNDPDVPLAQTLFNDGKCDPQGRFYTGTISQSREGAFYRLDASGKVTKLFGGVGCSNGIAWSLDLKTMFYIDTFAHSLDAFDYNVQDGHIENRRTLIRYENKDVLPDGMTWDQEGRLWIAEWGGWNVTCWNPQTGERLKIVHVPSQYVTSCVFAGKDLDELYITTAHQDMSPEQLHNQPNAGGLFRVKTGDLGAPSYFYKGV